MTRRSCITRAIASLTMRKGFLVLGVSLSIAGIGDALSNDRFDRIRDHVRSEMADKSIPSVAIAVAKDGEIIWEEAFGWADRERMLPATVHTMYSVASVSKPITATGLMTLVQGGKVDLDMPANTYLGAAKLRARIGDVDQASVRCLANHSSGLPLHYRTLPAGSLSSRPTMDEIILRYGTLVTPPCTRTEYSNLGFGTIEYIIERVSGQRYAEFMRREVFLPLGMTRTSVGIGPGLEPYVASRYARDGLPIPFYEIDTPGAGSIYASAHDLVRFLMFHLKHVSPDQKAILSPGSIDEMHRRTTLSDEGHGYGIGFGISDKHGQRVVGHSGGMPGVATQIQLLPEQDLAIVVVSNARTQLPYSLVDLIISEFVTEWPIANQQSSVVLSRFEASANLLGSWKGVLSTYERDIPVELDFLPNGDVHAKLGDQPKALVDKAQMTDGVFSGSFNSRIETTDTRYEHKVLLSLSLHESELNGTAMASGTDRAALSGANLLAHWVALTKQ